MGCWPAPSPPLMTGATATAAASRAELTWGWRMAMTSTYWSTVRIVSVSVSPLAVEVDSADENPTTPPPRRCIAVSKERRVRVLGSKNNEPRT